MGRIQPCCRFLLPALIFIWIGAVVGVGMAAGARFAAIAHLATFLEPLTQMDNPKLIAFGIGQKVFTALNRLELLLAGLCLICLLVTRPGKQVSLVFAVAALMLGLQSIVWLPELVSRGDQLLAGQVLEPSSAHTYYLVAEATKILCLAITGFLALRALRLANLCDSGPRNGGQTLATKL